MTGTGSDGNVERGPAPEPRPSIEPDRPFVSRGGLKLDHALSVFDVDVRGLHAADFGCNVGGFTDCLLRRGADSVVAVDTGYGSLAWTLRNDARVTVRERSNALHAEPPPGGVDLVVIDLAWTPQRHAVPAALRWLRPAPPRGRVVTLIKPHYEVGPDDQDRLDQGVLRPDDAERVLERVRDEIAALGARPLAWTRSPLEGGKSTRRRGRRRRGAASATAPNQPAAPRGNVEFLMLLEPLDEAPGDPGPGAADRSD